MKKALLAKTLSRTGVVRVLRATPRSAGVLILNYHRVGGEPGSPFDRGLWSVSADGFRDQLRFLKSHYDVISPGELDDALRSPAGRHAMITFDDGYRDNYEVAFPILAEVGVPATFFVTTGFIESEKIAWWDEVAWMVRASPLERVAIPGWIEEPVEFDPPDRVGAIDRIQRLWKRADSNREEEYLDAVADATRSGRYEANGAAPFWMDWSMLREMNDRGMTIGGHTVNHPILSKATAERQRQEIVGCAADLRDRLGIAMDYFSYPDGGADCHDANTDDALRGVGVRLAFIQEGGRADAKGFQPFAIPRMAIDQHIDADWFRCLLELPSVFC